MKRRVAAALIASILAVAGVILIGIYVRGADDRAIANLQPSQVLVVIEEIPRGSAASLGDNVELRELPQSAIAPGVVTDLDQLSGLVADTVLHPGEQVFADRFTKPEALTNDDVVVPPNLVQVTVKLDPERVLGGQLKAGDTVGISSSYVLELEDAGTSNESTDGTDELPSKLNITAPLLSSVLVTRVQSTTTAENKGPVVQLITLAVSKKDAQRVVWTVENGKLYLTLERKSSNVSDTTVITQTNVTAR